MNQAYKSEHAAAVAQRLLARSERSPEGCLRWTGAHVPKGYGQIVVNRRTRPVHVVAHEVWIGPVPDGCDVDHVHANGCRHRDCIEPSHLEAVTHLENTQRRTRLITHCPQGHEYTPENTRRAGGKRRCKICTYAQRRARKATPKATCPVCFEPVGLKHDSSHFQRHYAPDTRTWCAGSASLVTEAGNARRGEMGVND